MKDRKFYAYKVPRTGKNGIADNWKECEKMVLGEKDARFKGFKSRNEAEDWLRAGADYSVKKKMPKGVYFDAGTGRGAGVEVSVTEENGKNLLGLILPASKLNRFGKLVLPADATNNYGELLGLKYALEIALQQGSGQARKKGIKRIYGDSRIVIDYWSKGFINMKEVMPDTIEMALDIATARKEFEKSGGKIKYVEGGDNPADLGFHK